MNQHADGNMVGLINETIFVYSLLLASRVYR